MPCRACRPRLRAAPRSSCLESSAPSFGSRHRCGSRYRHHQEGALGQAPRPNPHPAGPNALPEWSKSACDNPDGRSRPRPERRFHPNMSPETSTWTTKKGLAQMLKGGVIMDVVTPDHAKIAEDAGAV